MDKRFNNYILPLARNVGKQANYAWLAKTLELLRPSGTKIVGQLKSRY